MTLAELQKTLRDAIRETAASEFKIDVENIAAEVPPKPELGDVAFPVAFELAKLIKQQTGEKQNPRAIAEVLKSRLEAFDFVDRVEIAGPGYLNVFFDRAAFLIANADTEPLPAQAGTQSARVKVCVEHTSVNPNKAAHIGHVRNSVLGDTFQRILTATGKQVEVQNYIDNTGVQVADVVVGFIYLENRDLDSIKQLDAELKERGESFDYYCWDLYARVGQEYANNEELKEKRAEVLHLIEEGDNPTAELADHVATRNVECITETMERLSIRYDLLPRESEILHLHFWDKAFETMKELGVIHYVDEGKQKGCWVMPFEEHEGSDEHEGDKILVRSNGTVTYTGKDIAYQMWKLGILGLDFNYRRFYTYPDGREVWMTTARSGDTPVPMSAEHEPSRGRKGWNRSGKLPHFDGEVTQFVTFRLVDSLPESVLDRFRQELEHDKLDDGSEEFRQRVQEYLDSGAGECILRDPQLAEVVESTLLNENGISCDVKAWVIMPNHAHVLLRLFDGYDLAGLMKRVKGISARRINELRGTTGAVWQADYFDRYIRDADHFANVLAYIENNPVISKLSATAADYRFSSAYARATDRFAASGDGDKSVPPPFGGGETIYNVIDTRQSYPQEVVKKGVAAISPERGEKASIHLAYEMVALSPAAAEELGFKLSEEDKGRTFIEMSGRKGLGVKADDLIDRLEANALVEVESRHPDAPVEEKKHIAHQIAVGALRYFLLKFTRNTVIVFDFKEALSFEGETGAFCQYSAVRANSIFRKLGSSECELPADPAAVAATLAGEAGTDIWSLITLASRLEEIVESAAAANEPAILAKYTFTLAKAFNSFYRDHKIIAEPDADRRAVLISVADLARRSLTAALNTLGIDVPEKM